MNPNRQDRARPAAPAPDRFPAAPRTVKRDDPEMDLERDEDDLQQLTPVRLPQRAYDRTMPCGSDDD